MDISDRLYVQIHPLQAGQIPHPHPIDEARFDPAYVYKVLGMYNPSETSECYFVLANTQRQIWFIPQRHLLAYGLINSDEFFLKPAEADTLGRESTQPKPGFSMHGPANNDGPVDGKESGFHIAGTNRAIDSNGHQGKNRIPFKQGS